MTRWWRGVRSKAIRAAVAGSQAVETSDCVIAAAANERHMIAVGRWRVEIDCRGLNACGRIPSESLSRRTSRKGVVGRRRSGSNADLPVRKATMLVRRVLR